MPKGLMYNITVSVAKGYQAPGLQGDDFFFLQPFYRLLKLFPEELSAEAYFSEDQFSVFKHEAVMFMSKIS